MEAIGLTVTLWQKPDTETSTLPLPRRKRVTKELPFEARCRQALLQQVTICEQRETETCCGYEYDLA